MLESTAVTAALGLACLAFWSSGIVSAVTEGEALLTVAALERGQSALKAGTKLLVPLSRRLQGKCAAVRLCKSSVFHRVDGMSKDGAPRMRGRIDGLSAPQVWFERHHLSESVEKL